MAAHADLIKEMCDNRPPGGRFDLFAIEVDAAAMCYIFDSAQINRLFKRADRIAIGAPLFTPYRELRVGKNLVA